MLTAKNAGYLLPELPLLPLGPVPAPVLLPVPDPELDPEPMPLEPAPVLEPPTLLPEGDEVLLLPDVPPLLAPLLPLVMPSSFKHFSRSVPTMPRHLLLLLPAALLPDAPEDALPVLGEVVLLPVALGVLLPAALGVLPVALGVLLPVALGVLLPDALGALLAPPDALLLSEEPDDPVAPALVLGELDDDAPLALLPDEPALCAIEALAIAKSAAAVAVLMIVFNIVATSWEIERDCVRR